MRGREVLLLQGLDQVWAVLGVNAPERTFSTGLVGKTHSQHVAHVDKTGKACKGGGGERAKKQVK